MFVRCGNIGVAYHAFQDFWADAGADGGGYEGVAAVVWGHVWGADFLHEGFEVTLGEICACSAPCVAVNQERTAGLFCGFQETLIGAQAYGAYGYDAVSAGVGFGASYEIVLGAVSDGGGEQLVGAAAGGDEDDGNLGRR